jgi:hypothetical protein
MKSIFTSVIIGAVLFISGYACASERFSSTLFSVEIPAGMIADDKKDDALSLIFAGDNDIQKGTLSVSAKEGKIASFEDQWQKVRPVIIGDKTILFQKEVATSVLTWKAVGLKGQTGPLEMQNIIYYGVLNNVIYMMHYHCQLGRCDEIDAAFRTALDSFKPSGDIAQPNTPLEPSH